MELIKSLTMLTCLMACVCLYYLFCFLCCVELALLMFLEYSSDCLFTPCRKHTNLCCVTAVLISVCQWTAFAVIILSIFTCDHHMVISCGIWYNAWLNMDNCPIYIKSVLKHAKKSNVYYVIPITAWNVLLSTDYLGTALIVSQRYSHSITLKMMTFLSPNWMVWTLNWKQLRHYLQVCLTHLNLTMMIFNLHCAILILMLTFFNALNAHISQSCNYSYEHPFPNVIQQRFNHMMTENTFSLCHNYIRSQKANLKPFEICLENLEFQFSVIGITEAWLKDFNSD